MSSTNSNNNNNEENSFLQADHTAGYAIITKNQTVIGDDDDNNNASLLGLTINKRIKQEGIEGVEYPIRGTGWIHDIPDFRDLIYEPFRLTLSEKEASSLDDASSPRRVDLREVHDSKYPILDQGDLGSCTAFSIGSLLTYNNIKQDVEDTNPTNDFDRFMPSPLFIYYNERAMENTIYSDSGAYIRDGIKSIAKQGACAADTWKYDITKFKVKPPQSAYTEALDHQAILYFRINNNSLQNMKACLTEGFPFVFGFSVYTSFMSNLVAQTGKVPYPSPVETLLGGHAVLCVGYDDYSSTFICRNQWGEDWGDRGYFYMPYRYLTNRYLASDFWTVKKVEESSRKNIQEVSAKILERQFERGIK